MDGEAIGWSGRRAGVPELEGDYEYLRNIAAHEWASYLCLHQQALKRQQQTDVKNGNVQSGRYTYTGGLEATEVGNGGGVGAGLGAGRGARGAASEEAKGGAEPVGEERPCERERRERRRNQELEDGHLDGGVPGLLCPKAGELYSDL